MNPDSLHSAIMNLPCRAPDVRSSRDEDVALQWYRLGHRDARHAAAELVAAAAPQGAQPVEPVAVRYKMGSGRWRYLNLPFTKGWTFPESLGTPEPLYASPADAAPVVPQEVRSDTPIELLDEACQLFENIDGDRKSRWHVASIAKKLREEISRRMNAGLTIPAPKEPTNG